MEKRSSKIKKKRRKHLHQLKGDAEFILLGNPFEGFSREELEKVVRSIGEEGESEYHRSWEKLNELLLEFNPLLLMSVLAFYGFTTSGGTSRELTDKNPTLPHHLELLQSIMLRYKIEQFNQSPILDERAGEVHPLLESYTRAFNMMRFKEIDRTATPEERALQVLSENIRLHTQAVRNLGYPQQIYRIARDLFACVEDKYFRLTGIKLSGLIGMVEGVYALIEQRIREHIELIAFIWKQKTIAALVKKYYEVLPDLAGSEKRIVEFIEQNGANLEQAKRLLLAHSNIRLVDVFSLSVEDFINAYSEEIDLDLAKDKILGRLSMSFGDLEGQNPDYVHMKNPVWLSPIVKVGDDSYFFPLINMALSFCHEIIELFIQDYPELTTSVAQYKGSYLETEVYTFLNSSLPGAKIFQNIEWEEKSSGTTYENDILICMDSVIFIFECKSAAVTESGRRGGPDRLRRKINELIVEPSVQGGRLKKALLSCSGKFNFRSLNQESSIEIPSNCIISCFNITLEDMGNIQTSRAEIDLAELIPKDIEIFPTMTLTDLEIILHVLESTSEIVNYLIRRDGFEANFDFFGDEIDLLSFYLDSGFNLDLEDSGKHGFALTGESFKFDPYFLGIYHGFDESKPRKKQTDWWAEILRVLEIRRPFGWLKTSMILNTASFTDQRDFEKMYRNYSKSAKKKRLQTKNSKSALLITKSTLGKALIVGFTYSNADLPNKKDIIESIASTFGDKYEVEKVVALGINIDDESYPYNIIGYFE